MCTVIDHTGEEELTSSSLPADHDAIQMCRHTPTPMCSVAPSTVLTTISPSCTFVQQNIVSSDDCNVAAIVIPTVLVIAVSTVIICIVAFMAIRWKKGKGRADFTTSTKNEITCIVNNDLYE